MADEPKSGGDEKSDTQPLPKVKPADPPQEAGGEQIDVKGMIKQASRRVRVDQLVKRGTKYISLLSKDKINQLINQAVKTIIGKYKGAEGLEGVDIEGEAKQDFNELMQQYQESSKARGDLATSRDAIANELQEMQQELEQQKRIADGKLDEEAETMLLVGFKEFENELNRVFQKVYEKRQMILGEDDEEGQKQLELLSQRLKIVVAKLVEAERARFSGKFAKDREIAILERRIAKLMEQMKSMENALKMISNQKLFSNQQIANVLRELGLSPEDEAFKKKKEMLKIVFEQNVDLRKEIDDRKSKGERVIVT